MIKILRNQGFETLSSLFVDIQSVNSLFQRDTNIESKNRKRKSKNPNTEHRQQKPCRRQTSQPVYSLVNVQISEDRPLGIVRNSQSNMEDAPDPPVNYRSMGIVGSKYCETTKRRNQMSMMALWKSSCNENERDFHGEISA